MVKFIKKIGLVIVASLILLACSSTSSPGIQPEEIEGPQAYEEAIATDQSFIYFYKDDCPYCHVFEAFMDQLPAKAGVKIYSYDVDANYNYEENTQIMKANGIGLVPKLVEYNQSVQKDSVNFENTYQEISDFLQETK